MSTVIIVHGWEGNSKSDWIPWLARELKQREIEVIAPDMPNTDKPRIDAWVSLLKDAVKEVNEDVYFVGHSIGCQAIVRYLQDLPREKKIGGAVFVAPWTKLIKEGYTEEENKIIGAWEETPIKWEDAKSRASYFVCIYSDNDPVVSVKNAEEFGRMLRAKLILDAGRGHFSEEDGVTQLPVARDELLAIMGMPVETTAI